MRLPSALSFEKQQLLVSRTLPAIDRLLESGRNRAEIVTGINSSIYTPELPESEQEERRRIGGFLKAYVDERLKDPETRVLNRLSAFRLAHGELFGAQTPEELNRAAENFLRDNLDRSAALRLHQADPERHPRPEIMPLSLRERNLLFFGRAPDHYTPEMRELRHFWGLSRAERAERVQGLREGNLVPSPILKEMVVELESRKTLPALRHYQAAILNEEMRNPGRWGLRQMYVRLPPHERTYLVEEIEGRKQTIAGKSPVREAVNEAHDRTLAAPSSRAFGAAPRESSAYREYLESMNAIEHRLLNQAVHQRQKTGGQIILDKEEYQLTITEARSLLPPEEQVIIRNQVRNLAWEQITPPEVLATRPEPSALHLGETIAHLQENTQERARLAHQALDEFLREKVGTSEKRDKVSEETFNKLPPADAQRLKELQDYAARTREELYRGFESLDALRREIGQSRTIINVDRQQMDPMRATPLDQDQSFPFNEQSIERISQLNYGEEFHSDRNSTVTGEPATETENHEHRVWQVDSDQRWHFDSLPSPPESIPNRDFASGLSRDDIDHDFTYDR